MERVKAQQHLDHHEHVKNDSIFPSSQITWVDGSSGVLTDGVSTVRELLPDSKRFSTISTLVLSASRRHHGRNFTCQAQNSADRQPHSTSIRSA